MNEPRTDAEFKAALTSLRHAVHEIDEGEYCVQNMDTGAETLLDADDYSSALFEAWHLVRD